MHKGDCFMYFFWAKPAWGQLLKENTAKNTYCLRKLNAKQTVKRGNIHLRFTLVIIRARLLFHPIPFFPNNNGH